MIGFYLWPLSILAAGVAAYGLTWRWAGHWPAGARRVAWGLSAAVTAGWLAATFSLLPGWAGLDLWVIQLRSWRALDWTLPLVGVFAALLQLRTNRRRPPKGAFSRHNGLTLAVLLMLPPHLNALAPPAKPRWADEWKDGVCLQSEGYTCGAAATATILRLHGLAASEAEVAAQVCRTERGAWTWDALRYLRRRGLHPRLIAVPAKPTELPVPCLASVRLGGPGGIVHMLTVLEQTSQTFVIGDPLGGRFEWSREMTWENYHFTGVVIHVPS